MVCWVFLWGGGGGGGRAGFGVGGGGGGGVVKGHVVYRDGVETQAIGDRSTSGRRVGTDKVKGGL